MITNEDLVVKDGIVVLEKQLIEGVPMELQKQAEEIIKTGYETGQDDDDIRASIMGLGIKFGHVIKIHKALLKELGLVVDIKAIKKEIKGYVIQMNLTGEESWDTLNEFADAVCGTLTGATPTMVFSHMRAVYKDLGRSLPTKPKKPKNKIFGMGRINRILIDTFQANPDTTQEELKEVFNNALNDPKKATRYVKSHYAMCFALANGFSVEKLLSILNTEV